MAATTPQALFAESACFCAVTSQAYETMKLALLSNIIQTLGVTMTIPELIDYGKCYACLGLSTAQTAELALLDLISANVSGGGGGGASNSGGVVDPEGVVSGVQWQFYTNTALQTYWQKQSAGTGTTGWVQLI